jgi:hypothetical protein
MQFHDVSESEYASNFCANLGESATQTLKMIRQAFKEESLSST